MNEDDGIMVALISLFTIAILILCMGGMFTCDEFQQQTSANNINTYVDENATKTIESHTIYNIRNYNHSYSNEYPTKISYEFLGSDNEYIGVDAYFKPLKTEYDFATGGNNKIITGIGYLNIGETYNLKIIRCQWNEKTVAWVDTFYYDSEQ